METRKRLTDLEIEHMNLELAAQALERQLEGASRREVLERDIAWLKVKVRVLGERLRRGEEEASGEL